MIDKERKCKLWNCYGFDFHVKVSIVLDFLMDYRKHTGSRSIDKDIVLIDMKIIKYVVLDLVASC